MSVLIDTRNQIQVANIDHANELGPVIYKRLHTDINFVDTLFYRNFSSENQAFRYKQLMHKRFENGIVCPPLIIRSNENIEIRLDCVVLLCYEAGPIIPVVTDSSNSALAEVLRIIYSLRSTNPVTRQNIIPLLLAK